MGAFKNDLSRVELTFVTSLSPRKALAFEKVSLITICSIVEILQAVDIYSPTFILTPLRPLSSPEAQVKRKRRNSLLSQFPIYFRFP